MLGTGTCQLLLLNVCLFVLLLFVFVSCLLVLPFVFVSVFQECYCTYWYRITSMVHVYVCCGCHLTSVYCVYILTFIF